MTVEEFDRFVDLPENADRLFEYIGGEIVEVPSRPYASSIAGRISFHLGDYVFERRLGHITGKKGGYVVAGERYMPDAAYISKQKQPELPWQGYNPNPPDLAVEVDSPSTYQTQEKLRFKVINYLRAGTVVWLVRPEIKTVEVYAPGQPVRILDVGGTLDGGEALPGFQLAVKDIFPVE